MLFSKPVAPHGTLERRNKMMIKTCGMQWEFTPGMYRNPTWGKEIGEKHARTLISQYSSRIFTLEEVTQSVRTNLELSRELLHSGLERVAYFQARIDIFERWLSGTLTWEGWNNE